LDLRAVVGPPDIRRRNPAVWIAAADAVFQMSL
jgi:hypothetical protein